jgi:ABC-type uncharacterized transport system ATPase subunit
LALTITGLSKTYPNGVRALKDLSLTIGNSMFGLLGANGAGKSTLMRILQGVDSPDEGGVVLDDVPVRLAGPADAFARGIGMVHQEFMLAPNLTLLENLILAREPRKRRPTGSPRSPASRSTGGSRSPMRRCISARFSKSCVCSIAGPTC